MDALFRFEITVSANVVDENRHVSNIAYLQWMQEAAIQHSGIAGCTAMTQALGATWIVRTHHIDYLRPAFAGDAITLLTWVANFRKVRSLRRYKFIRTADRAVLAQGETDWVFVDANSGRPRAIPDEIKNAFVVTAEEPAS